MKNNTIEHEIRRRTEAFAAELHDLIRRSVLDTIQGTFGAASQAAPSAVAPSASPRSKGRTGRGRGPSGANTVAILDFVSKNPGSRAEQIAKGLGATSARLKKAIAAMLVSGQLEKTGQRRGTQYHPGKAPVAAEGESGTAPQKSNGRRGKGKASRNARKKTTKRAPRG